MRTEWDICKKKNGFVQNMLAKGILYLFSISMYGAIQHAMTR